MVYSPAPTGSYIVNHWLGWSRGLIILTSQVHMTIIHLLSTVHQTVTIIMIGVNMIDHLSFMIAAGDNLQRLQRGKIDHRTACFTHTRDGQPCATATEQIDLLFISLYLFMLCVLLGVCVSVMPCLCLTWKHVCVFRTCTFCFSG